MRMSSEWEQRPNQTNAARASHPSRTYVISCTCPITAKQRNDRFSRTALEEMPSAAFAEASCRFVTLRSRLINRRSGQRSCPAPKSRLGEGGRNARATSSRLRTLSGFPPAIHPRESPAAADSAAIIRPAQETSRFAGPTLRQKRCPSQHKNFATL